MRGRLFLARQGELFLARNYKRPEKNRWDIFLAGPDLKISGPLPINNNKQKMAESF